MKCTIKDKIDFNSHFLVLLLGLSRTPPPLPYFSKVLWVKLFELIFSFFVYSHHPTDMASHVTDVVYPKNSIKLNIAK